MQREYSSKCINVCQKIIQIEKYELKRQINTYLLHHKTNRQPFQMDYNRKNIALQRMESAARSFPAALQFASRRKLPVTMLDSKMFRGNFCSRFIVITHERASNEACHENLCIYTYISSYERAQFLPVPSKKILCKKFQACAFKFVRFVTVCCTYYCYI